MTQPPDCRRALDAVAAYLSGDDLPAGALDAALEHAGGCATCRDDELLAGIAPVPLDPADAVLNEAFDGAALEGLADGDPQLRAAHADQMLRDARHGPEPLLALARLASEDDDDAVRAAARRTLAGLAGEGRLVRAVALAASLDARWAASLDARLGEWLADERTLGELADVAAAAEPGVAGVFRDRLRELVRQLGSAGTLLRTVAARWPATDAGRTTLLGLVAGPQQRFALLPSGGDVAVVLFAEHGPVRAVLVEPDPGSFGLRIDALDPAIGELLLVRPASAESPPIVIRGGPAAAGEPRLFALDAEQAQFVRDAALEGELTLVAGPPPAGA